MTRSTVRYGFGMAMLAACACLGGAQAVAEGAGVPIKGSYSGFAWLEPDFSGAHCEGYGQVSHMGRVSTRFDAIFLGYGPMAECAGIGTGWGIPNINNAVITAANGDQLALVFYDLACEIIPFIEYEATGQWYVDSAASTGRFAGATGGGSMVGGVNFATGKFRMAIRGMISY